MDAVENGYNVKESSASEAGVDFEEQSPSSLLTSLAPEAFSERGGAEKAIPRDTSFSQQLMQEWLDSALAPDLVGTPAHSSDTAAAFATLDGWALFDVSHILLNLVACCWVPRTQLSVQIMTEYLHQSQCGLMSSIMAMLRKNWKPLYFLISNKQA